MTNTSTAFLVVLVIGFVPLFLGLLGAELDFHIGSDGLDFVKPVPIGIGFVFAGAAGLITEQVAGNAGLAVILAVLAFIAGFALGIVMDKFMTKDGGNVHYDRQFFQGQIGVVDIEVRPGAWGLVKLSDKSGALTSHKADTREEVALAKGDKVIVIDVADNHLTVEKCPFE